MVTMKKTSSWTQGWRAWVVFALVHVLVLGSLAWLATDASQAHPELSPQATQLRLIPLSPH
jgi:hypothetical protein